MPRAAICQGFSSITRMLNLSSTIPLNSLIFSHYVLQFLCSEKMVYISIPILKGARASFPHPAYKEKGDV